MSDRHTHIALVEQTERAQRAAQWAAPSPSNFHQAAFGGAASLRLVRPEPTQPMPMGADSQWYDTRPAPETSVIHLDNSILARLARWATNLFLNRRSQQQ